MTDQQAPQSIPQNNRPSREEGGFGQRAGRGPRRGGPRRRDGGSREAREFDQKVIEVNRVTRVVKGGKRMRFRALVVIGDRKGRVGIGLRKGVDVPESVAKAVAAAKKNMIEVKIHEGTIPHEAKEKYKASVVFLKPASAGTGVIAGGAVRQLLDLAGVKNVLSKIYGSRNKVNTLLAAFNALAKMERGADKRELRKS